MSLAACGGGDQDAPAVGAVPGTQVVFELEPAAFFDFPYPSDLRLTETGTPDLRAFPNPKQIALLDGLIALAGDRRGFPVLPVAYFRFDGPLAPRSLDTVVAADPGAPLLLIDVDPGSDERGKLFATIASTLEPDDVYVPENLLAVAAYPGIVLHPERRYAFVVRRSALDADGEPLGVPLALEQLKAGRAPAGAGGAQALESYAPLWETLDAIGVPRADVAAATVFTTGDVVADTEALSSGLLARQDVVIESLAVDPGDGAAHERFCELHGSVRFPQFQRGTPPFDSDGWFEIGGDGLPVQQREEVAPVVITLPKQPMPADGHPLVIYFHGSGGLSTQVVDRGANGEPPGRGPAHVLAAHGFATAASALPLNPERLPGASDTQYLNFDNLASFRDIFRQGVIEQRLLLDALAALEIPASVVAACNLPALPAGASGHRLDVEPLFAMGQSMGGMYTNLFAAVEPRVASVVPTGAGGFWSLFVVETQLIGNLGALAAIAFGLKATSPLTHVHPVLHVLQTGWEPAEPVVHMPRLGHRPLPGHPVRNVYQPVGKDDSYFPTTLYDAIALAYGHQQAGDVVWPTMQQSLALGGLDGIIPYPVENNLVSVAGTPFTGVVVQYDGDGSFDTHEVFSQLDVVKHQYGCFLQTARDRGTALLPPPAATGTPCP